MKVNKIFLNLFLILLFFISINIVYAQEDFTASSRPSVEMCPCSNQAYQVTVKNTGDIGSSYTVLADGDAAGWITFNPGKFVLNAGQKGSFFVFVNSLCNIEGEYGLNIFITTSNGLTKVVRQKLKFSECYDYSFDTGDVVDPENVKFEQHSGSYSLCKDEKKAIPILLANKEKFENRYDIFLDAPEWAELSVNNAQLGAEKTGIFLISLDAKEEGKFNLNLNAVSELGKVQRESKIEAKVEECYELDVEIEKEKDIVCTEKDNTYDVTIKNSGALGHDVKLNVIGVKWASFGNDTMYISTGEEKTAELKINPGNSVSGNFEVNAIAEIENKTGLKFSDVIIVEVVPKNSCYKAVIGAKNTITNFYARDFFFAEVKNDGIKKAEYEIGLEGVSWVKVSPDSLALNPGQSGNLNLEINPNSDIEAGTYGIKINLESNDEVYSKNIDIQLRKENEFVKQLKEGIRAYQYYIYLLLAIVIIILIFLKPILKTKNRIKKNYEKYKVKRQRLLALKSVRKAKREEKAGKDEENREEKKRGSKKEQRRERKKKQKKGKGFLEKYKSRVYSFIALIVVLVFLGQYFKLYNLKYTDIYLRNIFYGYLFYILIGVGAVIVLFLLTLLYNFISKKGKKSTVDKIISKKTVKKWHKAVYFKIFILALIVILIYALPYFLDSVRDFFVLYSYYFGVGIVILIIVILALRFYKKIFKFLKE